MRIYTHTHISIYTSDTYLKTVPLPGPRAGIVLIEPSHTSVASLGLGLSPKPWIDPWAQPSVSNRWELAHKGLRSLTSWVGPVKYQFYATDQSFSAALSPVTHSGSWLDSTPFTGCLPFPVSLAQSFYSVLYTSQIKHTHPTLVSGSVPGEPNSENTLFRFSSPSQIFLVPSPILHVTSFPAL